MGTRVYHQYSRHLVGALVLDKIDFYRNYPEKVGIRFRHLNAAWFVDISTGFYEGTNVFHWLEHYILDQARGGLMDYHQRWNLCWDALIESLQLQLDYLTISSKKQAIINIHNALRLEAEKGLSYQRIEQLPEIKFCGDLVVLESFPRGPIVITYQMFVSITDKIEPRLSWLYYVLYSSMTPRQALYNTNHLFESIYYLCEQCYEELGNTSARFFKMLEPLCIGILLRMFPAEWNDHNFITEIYEAAVQKDSRLGPFLQKFIVLGENYLNIHGVEGIPYLIEQFGQEKLHNWQITSGEEAYFERNKLLPKVIDSFRMPKSIKQICNNGRPPSFRECWRIPSADWSQLEFRQNHHFNYYPPVTDLLDDKAISPHYRNMYQLFAQDALDIIGQVKPTQPQHTRLILEILDREIIDIKAFYTIVEKLRYVPKQWALIQLMAKERELKLEARVFSILTFECRMMASACERNIGEQILPLFKQQSMTLSGAQLRQKMDNLSTLLETEDQVWIRFHMDLEQWNYTFRSYQQVHILDVPCNLFNVHHFRYMPNIFTDGLLISANKFSPPGFPGSFNQWSMHAGGNQGILQKLWTLITILVIRRVMFTMDFDHRLTGSGDNQVLFVRLFKNDKTPEIIKLIKTNLRLAFDKVGLALKLEETWHSSHITCYQRSYHIKGVKVPGGIKASNRAFAGSGDINSGINAIVTTATNGGTNLAEQQSDSLLGPGFALLEILLTLLGDVFFRAIVPLNKERLVLLTLLSSDFGYLPMQLLMNFLYAGHQDTLSESLSLLKFVWDHYDRYKPVIAGPVRFHRESLDKQSLLQLVLEPSSLNISRPKLPEALELYKLGVETEFYYNNTILLQRDISDGKMHPVYYASGKTTPAESGYTIYELRVLAIVKAPRKFRDKFENIKSLNKRRGKKRRRYCEDDRVAIKRTQLGPDLQLATKKQNPVSHQNPATILSTQFVPGDDTISLKVSIPHHFLTLQVLALLTQIPGRVPA
ncbi:hypothetical protein M0804_013156 [Polistes exclamans]|nr:hypothetical protein M0804_013156 [Polistes exclamans]